MQVLIYGDCAVNVHPTSQELAQIAVTSADTAAAFGIEPRVAVLSYSTFGSGSGPEVDKVSRPTPVPCAAAMENLSHEQPSLNILSPHRRDP